MAVERRGDKWVARVVVNRSRHTVGVFSSEEEARACLALHRANVNDGTSPFLIPGALSIESYAESIGVRYGTVKRWIHEGMPVTRAGRIVVVIPTTANAWVDQNRRDTIAKNRRSLVYFAERLPNHAIKIGWTSEVTRRLYELSIEGRCEMHLLAAIPGDKPDEQRLHDRFANDRIADEWFRPSEALISFIALIGRAAA